MISIEEGKFHKLFLWYLTRTVSYFSILPLSFCSHHNFPLPLLSIRYLNGNPGRNSNYFGNLGYFRNFRVSSTSAPLVSRLSIKKENINLLMFPIFGSWFESIFIFFRTDQRRRKTRNDTTMKCSFGEK